MGRQSYPQAARGRFSNSIILKKAHGVLLPTALLWSAFTMHGKTLQKLPTG